MFSVMQTMCEFSLRFLIKSKLQNSQPWSIYIIKEEPSNFSTYESISVFIKHKQTKLVNFSALPWIFSAKLTLKRNFKDLVAVKKNNYTTFLIKTHVLFKLYLVRKVGRPQNSIRIMLYPQLKPFFKKSGHVGHAICLSNYSQGW